MFFQNLQKLIAAVDASLATWSGVFTMFHCLKLVESGERTRPTRWLPLPTPQWKNVEKKRSKSSLLSNSLATTKSKGCSPELTTIFR